MSPSLQPHSPQFTGAEDMAPFEEVTQNWKIDRAGDGELREKGWCEKKKRRDEVKREGGGERKEMWEGEGGMFQVSLRYLLYLFSLLRDDACD